MRVARRVISDLHQKQLLKQHSRHVLCRPDRSNVPALSCAPTRAGKDKEIAAELGITREKAARWRNRFLDGGIAALRQVSPRSGRPRR